MACGGMIFTNYSLTFKFFVLFIINININNKNSTGESVRVHPPSEMIFKLVSFLLYFCSCTVHNHNSFSKCR